MSAAERVQEARRRRKRALACVLIGTADAIDALPATVTEIGVGLVLCHHLLNYGFRAGSCFVSGFGVRGTATRSFEAAARSWAKAARRKAEAILDEIGPDLSAIPHPAYAHPGDVA
jgi:hypothetical protein